MGQAKNRGTFEERKAKAIEREKQKPRPKIKAPTKGSLAVLAASMILGDV